MPNYSTTPPPPVLEQGDEGVMFNAESPSNGQASKQFVIGKMYDGSPRNYGVWVHFASAPTVAVVAVQEAYDDADANYVTVFTFNFATPQTDLQQNLSTVAPFVRTQFVSRTAGGAVTTKVRT